MLTGHGALDAAAANRLGSPPSKEVHCGAYLRGTEEADGRRVTRARRITPAFEAVQGYTQLNKEHLLPALCKALGIEAHEHHAAVAAEKGFAIEAQMRELRAAAEKARNAGDYETLHRLRRQHHSLNHSLRTSAKRAMLQH